jgi:uroporphyrinogen decarboxylase
MSYCTNIYLQGRRLAKPYPGWLERRSYLHPRERHKRYAGMHAVLASKNMNRSPRERVQLTIQHQEPDRVPIALGGGPYGIVDALYFKLLETLQIGEPVAPFRQGHSISYMDDRLLERLGIDFRYVYPNRLPNSPVRPGKDPGTFYDSYGQVWLQAQPYYYAGKGILSDMQPDQDLDNWISFPDPADPQWMAGVAERAKRLRQTTDYFITMRMVASHGVFQTACDLRGTENFLMDMAINPGFAQALLDKIADLQTGLIQQALEAGGAYFDMIELPGDDYASNVSTIISPGMFRKFIKPILERFVQTIRSYRPDLHVMLHSDGIITTLLDDLIEVGIDVIHPLEPLPGVDFVEIKRRFGERVTFLGAIDISHAMPGTIDDVIMEAKTRIEQLAPSGGYILAPSNHIQVDVPPENVVALFEAAHKYGQYPLARSK